MKQETISYRTRTAIILLTLLMHVLLLMLLWIQPHQMFINTELAQKLNQISQKTANYQSPNQPDWATIHPQQSTSGAPVILVPTDADAVAEKSHGAQKPVAQELTKPSLTDASQKKESPSADEKVLTAKSFASALPTTAIPIKQKNAAAYDPNYIPASLFKKKPLVEKNADPNSRSARVKKIDLPQLASEFTSHIAGTTSYRGPTMQGNASNAKITEDQLKFGQFVGKMLQSIKATWKAHHTECPPSAPRTVSLHLILTLNAKGTVTDVTFIRSTGSGAVDAFIKKVLTNASSCMPTIPASFGTDTWQLECFGELNPYIGPEHITLMKR